MLYSPSTVCNQLHLIKSPSVHDHSLCYAGFANCLCVVLFSIRPIKTDSFTSTTSPYDDAGPEVSSSCHRISVSCSYLFPIYMDRYVPNVRPGNYRISHRHFTRPNFGLFCNPKAGGIQSSAGGWPVRWDEFFGYNEMKILAIDCSRASSINEQLRRPVHRGARDC